MSKVMPLNQALKFFLVMVLALVVLYAGGAAAFVIDLLFHVALNVIVGAHLVSSTGSLPALPVAMGIWLLSVAVTFLYYRASL
jgi:hypothetical protein